MARQTREARRQADRAARRLRSDEEWLERHKDVFPAHDTLAGKRRLPAGVLARGDNVEDSSIEGRHIKGRLGKESLPAEALYGKIRARAGGEDDMDWGNNSIPKRALPNLGAADVGAATHQSVEALRQQVRQLKAMVRQSAPRR